MSQPGKAKFYFICGGLMKFTKRQPPEPMQQTCEACQEPIVLSQLTLRIASGRHPGWTPRFVCLDCAMTPTYQAQITRIAPLDPLQVQQVIHTMFQRAVEEAE